MGASLHWGFLSWGCWYAYWLGSALVRVSMFCFLLAAFAFCCYWWYLCVCVRACVWVCATFTCKFSWGGGGGGGGGRRGSEQMQPL